MFVYFTTKQLLNKVELYLADLVLQSISSIYNTLQTQPQAVLNFPSTMTYPQQSTPVPQAHPDASQSYQSLAQNINPNTVCQQPVEYLSHSAMLTPLQGFRSITQAATQTFAAARQLAHAPAQTLGGEGSLRAASPGAAAVGFQTYTTENGIKVYVGPFANAYAYFGLTPPNPHTAEVTGQSNYTRAGENIINMHATNTVNASASADTSSALMSSSLTDTANTPVSADKEPATPPRSQGQALSPSSPYSPIPTPVFELQKPAGPLNKSVLPEISKVKKKSQQKAKATEAESEPIVQALEVQQDAKSSNESVTPERAKTDVKGKGKAKQTSTGPDAAVFDLPGTKNIRAPRAPAATDKSVTMDAQLITTSKPKSDVGQGKKGGKAVETQKVGTQPSQPHAPIESLRFDSLVCELELEAAKNTTLEEKLAKSKQRAKGINTTPVATRTTRSRANAIATPRTMPKAKNRAEADPETPEVEGSSSRRSSGRTSLTPRPWWVAGSTPVNVAPIRAKSESVQPSSMNGKRRRSARNEEQNEQATEQHARKRTRRAASGIIQSDYVDENVQEEKASTRESQAIQDQIIDVIQEHDTTTTANGSDDESINDEEEYFSGIAQEYNGQGTAIAVYNSEEVSVKDEVNEYEGYQAIFGLSTFITMYKDKEPVMFDDDIAFKEGQTNDISDEGSFKDEVNEGGIQEFTDKNNREHGIGNRSQQQGGEEDLVDYDDLPQSPQRSNYQQIRLYPPNRANYDVAYEEDDSPEYPNYMRQQASRYDNNDVLSRSPQYSEGEYQLQDSENEYQPRDLDSGSGEYSDSSCENSDQLPPNHYYYSEIQGAIFDSSSSDPFQSPDRGRTLLQGTRRPFTGLSPSGPRETPPLREPSTSPRKRKRLLWREDGVEELIHPNSPRYLPYPEDALSSPGRGRTLLQGTRRAWTGLSPEGARETPPPREPSSSPRPRKIVRHLSRREGIDELSVPPSPPFYAISISSGSLLEEYDKSHQQIERDISYVDLVSDSSSSDTPLPPTPPPRVWPQSNVMGKRNLKKRASINPLKSSSKVEPEISYVDLVSHSSNSGTPLPPTPAPRVWPQSNVMGKRNLKKRASINPLKSSGNGVSKSANRKAKNTCIKSNDNDASKGGMTTSKSKARKTPQSPNPKSARITRSGAIGKIAGGNATKSRGRK